jgi:hypothetical protein
MFEEEKKAGCDLSEEELSAFNAILEEGKAVNVQSAKRQLPRACVVAILRLDGKIVGLGAIKQPRPKYARRISSPGKSGHQFDPFMHELGYFAVSEAHRSKGGSRKIINLLLSTPPGALWATTYNEGMKKILGGNGFTKLGAEWLNEDRTESLSLWIRPALQ